MEGVLRKQMSERTHLKGLITRLTDYRNKPNTIDPKATYRGIDLKVGPQKKKKKTGGGTRPKDLKRSEIRTM